MLSKLFRPREANEEVKVPALHRAKSYYWPIQQTKVEAPKSADNVEDSVPTSTSLKAPVVATIPLLSVYSRPTTSPSIQSVESIHDMSSCLVQVTPRAITPPDARGFWQDQKVSGLSSPIDRPGKALKATRGPGICGREATSHEKFEQLLKLRLAVEHKQWQSEEQTRFKAQLGLARRQWQKESDQRLHKVESTWARILEQEVARACEEQSHHDSELAQREMVQLQKRVKHAHLEELDKVTRAVRAECLVEEKARASQLVAELEAEHEARLLRVLAEHEVRLVKALAEERARHESDVERALEKAQTEQVYEVTQRLALEKEEALAAQLQQQKRRADEAVEAALEMMKNGHAASWKSVSEAFIISMKTFSMTPRDEVTPDQMVSVLKEFSERHHKQAESVLGIRMQLDQERLQFTAIQRELTSLGNRFANVKRRYEDLKRRMLQIEQEKNVAVAEVKKARKALEEATTERDQAKVCLEEKMLELEECKTQGELHDLERLGEAELFQYTINDLKTELADTKKFLVEETREKMKLLEFYNGVVQLLESTGHHQEEVGLGLEKLVEDWRAKVTQAEELHRQVEKLKQRVIDSENEAQQLVASAHELSQKLHRLEMESKFDTSHLEGTAQKQKHMLEEMRLKVDDAVNAKMAVELAGRSHEFEKRQLQEELQIAQQATSQADADAKRHLQECSLLSEQLLRERTAVSTLKSELSQAKQALNTNSVRSQEQRTQLVSLSARVEQMVGEIAQCKAAHASVISSLNEASKKSQAQVEVLQNDLQEAQLRESLYQDSQKMILEYYTKLVWDIQARVGKHFSPKIGRSISDLTIELEELVFVLKHESLRLLVLHQTLSSALAFVVGKFRELIAKLEQTKHDRGTAYSELLNRYTDVVTQLERKRLDQ